MRDPIAHTPNDHLGESEVVFVLCGEANRIVAGAWAETVACRPYLVVLDTDMILVGEPTFVRADVGVRPVDMKGSASRGNDDPLDTYWTRMCALGGIDPSNLPMLTTTIDRVAIRASFNGGFTVVRRDLGILQKTREIFFASLAENLRPASGVTHEIVASTGPVGLEASAWWGSSQAALSVAVWSTTSAVQMYDHRYNIPVHLLGPSARSWPTCAGLEPILLHYHYLAEAPHRARFLQLLPPIGCSAEVIEWVEEHI